MADGRGQMLDHDVREKLAHALEGRSDDYTLVMHCLYSFPEVITSQYCQIIRSHQKHEEGLKMFVDGMVKEFKSKKKQYVDNSLSLTQSGQDSSMYGHNDARPGSLRSTVNENTRIGVSPHIGCENAEFCGEVRSLVVTETVQHVSLPYSGPVPHASSQIDRNPQAEQPMKTPINSNGLSRSEKLKQRSHREEGPKRSQINNSGLSRLEKLQKSLVNEEPEKPRVGSSGLSRLERIQQSVLKDEGSKRSPANNSGLSRLERLQQSLLKGLKPKKPC